MEEILTPVNDGRVSDEGSQIEVNAVDEQSVNAESAEVTSGSQEQTNEEAASKARTQTKEENEQFAKVRREAEARVKAEFEAKQNARDAEFAQRAAQFGWVDSSGAPIKTEEAYWREVDLRSKMDSLISKGKDPEDALAIIERDRLKAEKAEREQRDAESARKQAENQAFFDFFKEANGREFTPADDIPEEVFRTAHENKIPLKYAYAEHLAKQAREKEKSINLGKQTAEVNAKNAQASTGSVTGSPQQGVITEADIDAHANDTAWMLKNYDEVRKVLSKKKG